MYFANQPDRITTEFGHPDVRDLLHRGINYLAGASIPFSTNAPESVHVGLTQSIEKPGNFVLSLVNTTSGPTRPVRKLVPVNGIEVNFKLQDKSLLDYSILRSQGDCKVQLAHQSIKLQISRLEDFFAIHLQIG